jgi:hypothetical protein
MRTETTELQAKMERTPASVRWLVLATLGLVSAGSAYLIWVRGEAIVVDLANLGAKVWCF